MIPSGSMLVTQGTARAQLSSTVFGNPSAGELWANHFATLVAGQENLKELGRLTLWEGAQPIAFRES